MTWHAYILRCADGHRYYCRTDDVCRRLAEHRNGLSSYTAARRPLKLLHFEEHETLAQAGSMERSSKNGRTRRKKIDHLIWSFPADKLAPFA